jgi:hypothetical protein
MVQRAARGQDLPEVRAVMIPGTLILLALVLKLVFP